MKRLMLPGFFVLFFCASAWAGGDSAPVNEPWPIIALFSDIHASDHCLAGIGYFPFHCFVMPAYSGSRRVSFSVALSSENLAVSDVEFAPGWEIAAGGELPGDVDAVSGECFIIDWNLLISATLFVAAESPESVSIGPFTGQSTPISYTCAGVVEWANSIPLMINDPGCWPIADGESSWGAIKRLFD